MQKITIPFNLPIVAVVNTALVSAAEVFRQRQSGPSGLAINGRFSSDELDGADPLYPGGTVPFTLGDIWRQ